MNSAYIAKCKCGGLVFAGIIEDTDVIRKRNAKEVADCIRRGFEVSTMSCEDARAARWCKNHGKCKVRP